MTTNSMNQAADQLLLTVKTLHQNGEISDAAFHVLSRELASIVIADALNKQVARALKQSDRLAR